MAVGRKKRHLGRRGGAVLGLELGKDFLRAPRYDFGQSREPRHMNAVAPVGGAGGDSVQKNDLAVLLRHHDVVVDDSRQPLGQRRQFVVMGGEYRLRPDAGVVVQKLDDRLGD